MYKVTLFSLVSLKLILTIHCASLNATSVKNANATEDLDKIGEFDLTKLAELSNTEFDRVYFKIINSMKRIGPESLRYMNRTDILETAFSPDSKETPEEVRIRWDSCCDHYKLDGNLYQFKDLVMNRVYRPPPKVKPPKKPPTFERTLLETEDAVPVKKK